MKSEEERNEMIKFYMNCNEIDRLEDWDKKNYKQFSTEYYNALLKEANKIKNRRNLHATKS